MCSLAAAVQGMDETVNNGAQAFYLKRFNITTARFSKKEVDNLTGLVVGAPYLACAILGCWLTEPLNSVFARRGTIFISCFIAAVASVVSFQWSYHVRDNGFRPYLGKKRVLNSSITLSSVLEKLTVLSIYRVLICLAHVADRIWSYSGKVSPIRGSTSFSHASSWGLELVPNLLLSLCTQQSAHPLPFEALLS